MMKTETMYTKHALRTIILRFDRQKKAPAFETLALRYFQELHDRTLQLKQQVLRGRRAAFPFTLLIEDVEELLEQAESMLQQLSVMLPEHREKQTVEEQLRKLLHDIPQQQGEFVQDLIRETQQFYQYDSDLQQYEQWMEETAFPQFHQVFQRYQECAIDIVSFDRDLEDFKGVLGAVKRQEEKYFDSMNELIERYDDLNQQIADFFDKVADFDPGLVP
ncbi:hypothetical protein [Sphingobacterium bambusae]|uniref:Uncharacterized protein n=1 Tax=Sphingobacterium bambusae TaxID=662858 RepID=A0ABW6BL58_9SPHI|nr:hypothetical protein [Sphingobacterium bambusae]WPL48175.1 hypothetical protein SCB77_19665 [Sphingobacterium bambusae]